MERIVGFNHDVLQGIRGYATPSRRWTCHFADPRPENVDLVGDWNAAGLLVFLLDPEVETRILKLELPVVDVANWLPTSAIPRVSVDDIVVGRLAAEHLAGLGHHNIAFVGGLGTNYGLSRWVGFQTRLKSIGYESDIYSEEPQRFPTTASWTAGTVDEEFLAWVVSLPKPVAVFAVNDERALIASETCHLAGLDVPDDVAILGVDDDPYLCASGYPPISSIAIPAKRIGFEAASLLDRLMNGGSAPSQPILFPPVGVINRQSTDMLAVQDPDVSSALRFIRENALGTLSVDDVVHAIPIGRRTLEKLFLKYIGRTPLEEIRHVRISKAQMLLATTDLTIDAIAKTTGFTSGSWLSTSFREQTGMTPSSYRRQFIHG